jgi:glyoxylase-like metal-dependent hydrolase (beta-lactamase superfamily II)
MPFLTEPEPPRGIATEIRPGIKRLVAENPGPMTYHGTNTYLLATGSGTVVLDPGPDGAAHREAILRETGGAVSLILLSHTHIDHFGGLAALVAATKAPVAAFHTPSVASLEPDIVLHDGDRIGPLTVLHTPGHAADHLCFAMDEADGTKLLFSVDHVMSWSSSIVNPPDGDMAAYYTQLRRLLDRNDDLYLPGHGPPLPNPRALVREMLDHRIAREAAIVAALPASGFAEIPAITDALYAKSLPILKLAAARNVLAHLLKLEAEGVAKREGSGWRRG